MTYEKAIKIIKVAKAEVEWNYPLDYQIAFDTAIEALEKQIKRKPIIINYGDRRIPYCPICLPTRCQVNTVINMLPSIDLDDYVPKDFHDKTCEAMAKAHQAEIADMVRVADRPQGEWVGEADGYADGEFVYDTWYCSNCDYVVDDDERPTWNYCPHCGAKMKGADDE